MASNNLGLRKTLTNITVSNYDQKKKENMEIDYENKGDHFFRTVKNRGFLVKATQEQLKQKALIFDYDEICQKIEGLMVKFTE